MIDRYSIEFRRKRAHPASGTRRDAKPWRIGVGDYRVAGEINDTELIVPVARIARRSDV